MNCIVIGAGNAGRPVARLLNHIGHDVTITDPKKLENFHEDFQGNLLTMENEGVTLDLGNLTPDLSKFDYVYAAPTLPDNSPAAIAIKNSNIKVISNDDFGRIVNKLI